MGWAKAYKELTSLLIGGQVHPSGMSRRFDLLGERLKTFGGRSSGTKSRWMICLRFTVDTYKKLLEENSLPSNVTISSVRLLKLSWWGSTKKCPYFTLVAYQTTDAMQRHGQWWANENPQRALSNNSVAYKENKTRGRNVHGRVDFSIQE